MSRSLNISFCITLCRYRVWIINLISKGLSRGTEQSFEYLYMMGFVYTFFRHSLNLLKLSKLCTVQLRPLPYWTSMLLTSYNFIIFFDKYFFEIMSKYFLAWFIGWAGGCNSTRIGCEEREDCWDGESECQVALIGPIESLIEHFATQRF